MGAKSTIIDGAQGAFCSTLEDVFGTNTYQEMKAEVEQRRAEKAARRKNNPISTIMRNVISFKTMEYQASMTAGMINEDERKHDERRDKYEERDEALEERNAMMTSEGNAELVEAMRENNDLMRQILVTSGGKVAYAVKQNIQQQKEAKPQKSTVRRMMEAKTRSLGESIEENGFGHNGAEYGE